MTEFKPGDRVRMIERDRYCYGEITIVRETDCKVIFNSELSYDYYPKYRLELITENDIKELI